LTQRGDSLRLRYGRYGLYVELLYLKNILDAWPFFSFLLNLIFIFVSLQALERCQLKDIVASKSEKLDALGLIFISDYLSPGSFIIIRDVYIFKFIKAE
jgi:hypothetical protein